MFNTIKSWVVLKCLEHSVKKTRNQRERMNVFKEYEPKDLQAKNDNPQTEEILNTNAYIIKYSIAIGMCPICRKDLETMFCSTLEYRYCVKCKRRSGNLRKIPNSLTLYRS